MGARSWACVRTLMVATALRMSKFDMTLPIPSYDAYHFQFSSPFPGLQGSY